MTQATEVREMVGGGKKKDAFAKAREAKMLKQADAQASADRMAKLEGLIGTLAGSVADLATKVEKAQAGVVAVAAAAPKIPTTGSPEANLGAFMKDMRQGEMREGVRKQEFMNDPTSDEIIPSKSIVALRPETQKYQAIARAMKLPEGTQILAQVLQYLGRKTLPSGKRLGPRKYKVHITGVGRDGVEETEINLVQLAA